MKTCGPFSIMLYSPTLKLDTHQRTMIGENKKLTAFVPNLWKAKSNTIMTDDMIITTAAFTKTRRLNKFESFRVV